MVENPPEKIDEQFPLLMVNVGEGDGSERKPPVVVAPGWNVTSTKPRRLECLERWPEFLSTCWMTLILFGISFLVFYAIGILAYKHNSFIIIKCNNNNSKQASEVYFHQIVQRGAFVPFLIYSEYLTYMASNYPHLHFNVIFLMDDSFTPGSRQSRLYLKPFIHANRLFADYNKDEIRAFEQKHQNVHISVISLNDYMTVTPLKYKWKSIPVAFLPFYLRVSVVWFNGGIAMDLTAYNNRFGSHKSVDKKIDAILKQHNDGIDPKEYSNMLKKIDQEEQNEFSMLITDLIGQVLNETRAFLNRSLSFYPMFIQETLTFDNSTEEQKRNKRDTGSPSVNITKEDFETKTKVELKNTTTSSTSNEKNSFADTSTNPTITALANKKATGKTVNQTNKPEFNDIIKLLRTKPEVPEVILFYDFSVVSDNMDSSQGGQISGGFGDLLKPNFMGLDHVPAAAVENCTLLTIESSGLFISAPSALHPFLGHIITTGCKRMCPNFVIHETLTTQCSGTYKNNFFCNNIFIL